MTDLAPSGLPRSGLSPAGQATPGPDLPVWDPLVRLSHWGIAVVVVGNAVFTRGGSSVHVALGWAGMGLLALRLIWGFVGPAEARFASFPPQPVAALRHLAGLARGRAAPTRSHNPAGAMMAYALWACLAVMTGTGLMMTGASPMRQAELEAAVAAGDWAALVEEQGEGGGESPAGEVVQEVHEVTANLILLLAALHLAGVAVESRLLRRNLVAPMLIRRRGRR